MSVSGEREEILRAVRDLGLTDAQFRVVPEAEARPGLERIEAHFVARPGLRWWWEEFRVTPLAHVSFADGSGWRFLTRLVPPGTETVWFVVETSHEFMLCEGTVEAVQSVIGECWPFEYHVVSHSLDWLLCENHSDVLYAVGEAVSERLIRYSA